MSAQANESSKTDQELREELHELYDRLSENDKEVILALAQAINREREA